MRVLATTNRNPEQEVREGRFRSDIYYRPNVLRIDIPPLRDRPEDVLPLAEHFLAGSSAETGKRILGFTPQALALLLRYSWPGNVRELRNEVARAAAGTPPGERIQPAALSARIRGSGGTSGPRAGEHALASLVEGLERRVIEQALEQFDDRVTSVARYLGLSRPGLRNKLARYGIRPKRGGRRPPSKA